MILSTIAETKRQAAYSAFFSGFNNILKNVLITIPNIPHLLLPLERTMRNKLMKAVTAGLI